MWYRSRSGSHYPTHTQSSLHYDWLWYLESFHFLFCPTDTHPESVNPKLWQSTDGSTIRLHFDLHIPQPKDPNREKLIHSASLKIFKAAVRPENLPLTPTIDLAYRINIYQLLEPVVHRNHKPLRRLLDSRLISLESTNWESFDIHSAVQAWSDDPNTNFGLEIDGQDENLASVVDLLTVQPDFMDLLPEELAPHLDVFTQTRTILSSRHKRSGTKMDCVQGDGEEKCCRFPLWISFKDIGWDDWIVHPKGFQAYFCDGTCPHRYKSAHPFSEIMSLINMHNPNAMPAPCCTATRLSPLPLVHYNEDGDLVISTFEDMIVEECKCAWGPFTCITCSSCDCVSSLFLKLNLSSLIHHCDVDQKTYEDYHPKYLYITWIIYCH